MGGCSVEGAAVCAVPCAGHATARGCLCRGRRGGRGRGRRGGGGGHGRVRCDGRVLLGAAASHDGDGSRRDGGSAEQPAAAGQVSLHGFSPFSSARGSWSPVRKRI